MIGAVVVARRAAEPLTERIELLRRAFPEARIVVADHRADADALLDDPEQITYLVDVNRTTLGIAVGLRRRGQPFIVDTGDDIATLTMKLRGRLPGVAFGFLEGQVLRRAAAVIHRGTYHGPLLAMRTPAPTHLAPDTVADEVIDAPSVPFDSDLVASFGSAGRSAPDRPPYGWEVVDLVAANADLRGLLVVRGPGREDLADRAHALGVADRVAIEGARPLPALLARLKEASFITSVQSDDTAGWVRTTGKLPLALGSGKGVVSTRVGEAALVLPDRFLVTPGSGIGLIEEMSEVIAAGLPDGWPAEAKLVAERFRRSRVATELAAFVRSLS